MSGGYDPNTTLARRAADPGASSRPTRCTASTPLLWPRSRGSWPGYVFTEPPLSLAAGHFGLGHGSGAHAPDEYYLIDSANPKLCGFDGSVRSFVDYLYELAG